jgi:hypothetical protein
MLVPQNAFTQHAIIGRRGSWYTLTRGVAQFRARRLCRSGSTRGKAPPRAANMHLGPTVTILRALRFAGGEPPASALGPGPAALLRACPPWAPSASAESRRGVPPAKDAGSVRPSFLWRGWPLVAATTLSHPPSLRLGLPPVDARPFWVNLAFTMLSQRASVLASHQARRRV